MLFAKAQQTLCNSIMFNGERLKKARQNKGYTQAQLEQVSGVKQQMISKLEIGRAGATADILNLAIALEVDPAWLQGLSEDQAPYNYRSTSQAPLNTQFVEFIFEFIKSEYQDEFSASTSQKQTLIFSICYETCFKNEDLIRKSEHNKLFPILSKELKQKL